MSGYTLHPFQREFGESVRAHYDAGIWSQLGILPTGGGKTVVFAHLREFLSSHLPPDRWVENRGLVLAHRDDLIEQAVLKLRAADDGIAIGVEAGDSHATPFDDVVVASVPTLAARRCVRLFDLGLHRIKYVVTDEAHHSPASTYQDIFAALGFAPPRELIPRKSAKPADLHAARAAVQAWRLNSHPGRLLLGVTATPTRHDAIGLEWTYGTVVYEKTLLWMIENGYLVPPRGFHVETGVDLGGLAMAGGEYRDDQLADRIDSPERNAQIVAAWERRCAGRPTAVFAATRQHSRNLVAAFAARGIRMLHVDGDTVDKRALYQQVENGEAQGLCNAQILTEGVDIPCLSAIVLARPVLSLALYMQILGRGLRLSPGTGKTDCIALDVLDRSNTIAASLGDLFGLPPGFRSNGVDMVTAARVFNDARARFSDLDLRDAQSVEDIERRIKSVDLWAPRRLSREVSAHASLRWADEGDGSYSLPLPELLPSGALGAARERVVIRAGTLGDYRIEVVGGILPQTVGMCDTLADAFERGERWIRACRPDVSRLKAIDAPWRKRAPSDAQLRRLEQWGIPYAPGITKGEASDLLDLYVSSRRG